MAAFYIVLQRADVVARVALHLHKLTAKCLYIWAVTVYFVSVAGIQKGFIFMLIG